MVSPIPLQRDRTEGLIGSNEPAATAVRSLAAA